MQVNDSVVFTEWSGQLGHFPARVGSDGSMSIHFLSCIGMILSVSTGSLFCGFAFAFDLAAITLTLVCDF